MRIKLIRVSRYKVPMRTPFVTADRKFTAREGLIIEITTDSGLCGIGEIAPLKGFSRESLSESESRIKALLPALRSFNIPDSIPAAWHATYAFLTKTPMPAAVAFGLETVIFDLASQAAGIPISMLLNPQRSRVVSCNAVIGGDRDNFEALIKHKLAAGFRTFKVKVGLESSRAEVGFVRHVRRLIGPDAVLRLDANGAFSIAEAAEFLTAISDCDIEYVEEPLRDFSFDSLAEIKERSHVPIAVDENVRTVMAALAPHSQVDPPLAGSGLIDYVVIKPMTMGGFAARKFQKSLNNIGVRVVITSTLETGIGVVAAISLASAFRLEAACGFDTLPILEDQLTDRCPLTVGGQLDLGYLPGLGVRLRDDARERYLKEIVRVD